MTSQTDTSKSSDRTLEEMRKDYRKRLKERKKSGISSKDIPSLTLKEQRELGINTEPTLVISFGRRSNNKRSS